MTTTTTDFPSVSISDLRSINVADVQRLADLVQHDVLLTWLQQLNPHGIGLSEQNVIYRMGYTGKQQNVLLSSIIQEAKAKLQECGMWAGEREQTINGLLQRYHEHSMCRIHDVCGEDIHRVFEAYRPGSCMRYTTCHTLRQIYALNPDSVRCLYMLRAENPGLEITDCSALYWVGRKYIYLDRLYQSGCLSLKHLVDMLADYLSEKYGKPCNVIYNDGQRRKTWGKKITFKLKRPASGLLPYCDTLDTVKQYDDLHVWLTSRGSGRSVKSTSGTPISPMASVSSCGVCGVFMLCGEMAYDRQMGHYVCEQCQCSHDEKIEDTDEDIEVLNEQTEIDTIDWVYFTGHQFPDVVLRAGRHQCRSLNRVDAPWEEIQGLHTHHAGTYADDYTYRTRPEYSPFA